MFKIVPNMNIHHGCLSILTNIILLSSVKSWSFTNPKFVKMFAEHFSRNNLIYYVPIGGNSEALKYHKGGLISYSVFNLNIRPIQLLDATGKDIDIEDH